MSESTKKVTKKKKRSALPNNSKIVNIETYKSERNIVIKKKDGYFNLPFYLESSILYNDSEYNKFIKDVEKKVRQSDFYSEYIGILKNSYGLNYCMFLGNVDSEDDVTVEMHHGPLLTLYDIVSVVTNSFLANNKKVSTFRIAKTVLEEHFLGNIQVIMLSKTVHELVHKGKIFIHPEQCIGNIQNFLDKYEDGLTEDLIMGINKYLDMAEKFKGTDNNLLSNNGVKSWGLDDEEKLTN
jgi:hypothetical protein